MCLSNERGERRSKVVPRLTSWFWWAETETDSTTRIGLQCAFVRGLFGTTRTRRSSSFNFIEEGGGPLLPFAYQWVPVWMRPRVGGGRGRKSYLILMLRPTTTIVVRVPSTTSTQVCTSTYALCSTFKDSTGSPICSTCHTFIQRHAD